MNLQELVAHLKRQLNDKINEYNRMTTALNELRGQDTYDQTKEDALVVDRASVEGDMGVLKIRLASAEEALREEQSVERLQAQRIPTGHTPGNETATADAAEGRSASRPFVRIHDGQVASVSRNQRFADHPVVSRDAERKATRDAAIVGQHGSLGQMLRAMSTSGGSAIVPTIWASSVIDRARNESAVIKAGANVIPMDAKTIQVGRLTADPTAAFRTEGNAITASDPTFDNVTLTATSMNALVIGSVEWFQDADNASTLVEDAIAKAMALQLDLAALYGQITTGAGTINLPAPAPKGLLANLLANAASSVLGGATNGTVQTAGSFFNELLDALYTPRDYNESPNAMIWNSKAARLYAKAYDTTGQPLAWPADLASVDKYVSNQIPSYTQGTMSNVATDVFVGDWAQLLIGQRLDITLQVLTERYADNGQIGIIASWRGDVGVARPRAFGVYRALKGNA